MNKEKIFKQINDFNNQKIGKNFLYEIYYYVPFEVAKDRAKFIKFILKNYIDNKFNNIIDLTFGSGNLTSHIILDNDINFYKLIFNDIEKNKDRVNKEIVNIYKNEGYKNVEISFKDVLNSDSFSNENKFDLIIFNPQIGGDYKDGEIKFETSANIIINNLYIEDYLEEEIGLDRYKLDIKINDNERKILITSKEDIKGKPYYRKKDLNELKNVKIYNYYDIFYEIPGTKPEGNATNIVKFRKTLDKISKDNTLIIFYGEKKNYELLFKDFKYLRYITNDNGSDIFILSKFFTKNECFINIEDNFKNINCEKNFNLEEKNYNLNELIKQIETNFKELSNIDSIWSNNENDEKASLEINKKDNKSKKQFKNFLKQCKGKK